MVERRKKKGRVPELQEVPLGLDLVLELYNCFCYYLQIAEKVVASVVDEVAVEKPVFVERPRPCYETITGNVPVRVAVVWVPAVEAVAPDVYVKVAVLLRQC